MKKMLIILILTGMGTLPAQEVEIEGEVIQKTEVYSPQYNSSIVELELKTQKGEMIRARLCPSWFFDSDIEKGERIRLIGKYENENTFMVREMVRNNIRYAIRDRNYEPLWIRTRLWARSCFYNPQTEKVIKCKVEEIYLVSPSLLMEARAKLENGEIIRVRLAPSWYLQNRVRVGDEIELRGSEIRLDSERLILAREMRNIRTKETITLRDMQGFPMWSGRMKGYGPGKRMERGRRGRW